MTLSEAQDEALVLIGMDATEDLGAVQLLVVDELQASGLAEWRGETPALTAVCRARFDRMLMD